MFTEKKIAVLDIGLSTVMMLLASYDKSGKIKIINEFGGITKLGDGIYKTGELPSENIKKTIDLCEEVINLAQKDGVEKIIVTASSALKYAKNKTEFLAGCQSRFNIFPSVLTEPEEVKLIYKGATSSYENKDSPIIVIEVGGYNTYVAFGNKSILIKPYVLNLGIFNAMESSIGRKLFPNFRSPIKKYLKENFYQGINEIFHWLENRKPVVLCTGTIASAYPGILLGRENLLRTDVEGRICYTKELEYLFKKLIRRPLSLRAKIPGMDKDRIRTLPPWMEIFLNLLIQLEIRKFKLTTNGLRIGILKTYLDKSSIYA